MSFLKKRKKGKVKKGGKTKASKVEKVKKESPGDILKRQMRDSEALSAHPDFGDGFTMVFECWICHNQLSVHYKKLEAVNSNTVGNCKKCGGKDSYEVVKRINDR